MKTNADNEQIICSLICIVNFQTTLLVYQQRHQCHQCYHQYNHCHNLLKDWLHIQVLILVDHSMVIACALSFWNSFGLALLLDDTFKALMDSIIGQT